MKLRLQLFSSYALIIIIMTVIMIIAHRNLNSLIDKEGWVRHTHQVISLANHVQKLLIDMETGQRGFVITGKENFLEPYNEGAAKYKTMMMRLQELVSDNPKQVQLLQEIDGLVQAWQEKAAIPEINGRLLVNKGVEPFTTVENMISNETGKSLMDSLREQVHQFIDNEERLLNQRREASISAAITTKSIIVSGTLIALFIGVASMIFIIQSIRGRVGGDPSEIDELASLIAGGKIEVAEQESDTTASGILASVIRMANDLQEVTEEKDELRSKLDDAVTEVNELRDIIPVCTHCKKIRDEKGAWENAAKYVARHPTVKFNQGICPACKGRHSS